MLRKGSGVEVNVLGNAIGMQLECNWSAVDYVINVIHSAIGISRSIEMNRCKVCGSPVLKAKERRRLDSALSTLCRNGIVIIASQCETGSSEEELRSYYSSGYACKKQI